MVQMAQPDELKDDLPKRLIKSGALIAFVWLVIHHEANPSFQAVVVTALEVRCPRHLLKSLSKRLLKGIVTMQLLHAPKRCCMLRPAYVSKGLHARHTCWYTRTSNLDLALKGAVTSDDSIIKMTVVVHPSAAPPSRSMPAFWMMGLMCAQLILKERSRALKMTVEGCLTLEQIVCLVR